MQINVHRCSAPRDNELITFHLSNASFPLDGLPCMTMFEYSSLALRRDVMFLIILHKGYDSVDASAKFRSISVCAFPVCHSNTYLHSQHNPTDSSAVHAIGLPMFLHISDPLAQQTQVSSAQVCLLWIL